MLSTRNICKILSVCLYILHVFSFDVALGAYAVSRANFKLFGTSSFEYWSICLSLMVWVVYFLDHYLDNLSLIKSDTQVSISQRRKFFSDITSKYKVNYLAIIATIASLYIAFSKFSLQQFLASAVISVPVLLYLFCVHRSQRKETFLKEPFIAITYTLALWVPAFWFGTKELELTIILSGLVFFLLVCGNLLIFALADKGNDKKEFQTSIVSSLTEKRCYVIGVAVLSLALAIGVICLILQLNINNLDYSLLRYANVNLINVIILIYVLLNLKRLTSFQARIVGDGIFVLYMLC